MTKGEIDDAVDELVREYGLAEALRTISSIVYDLLYGNEVANHAVSAWEDADDKINLLADKLDSSTSPDDIGGDEEDEDVY